MAPHHDNPPSRRARSDRGGVRRMPSTEASRASLIQPPPQVKTPPQYLSHEAADQIASDPDQPYDFIFFDTAVVRINAFLDQVLFSILDTARSPTFQRINLAAEAFLKSKLYLEAAAAAEQDLADFIDPEDRADLMQLKEREPSEAFDLEIVFKKSRLRVMSFMRFSDMEGDMELQFLQDEEIHSTPDYFPKPSVRWSKSRGNQVSELTSLFLCAMLEYIAELCIIAAARATVERHDTRSVSSEEDSDGEPLDPNEIDPDDLKEREVLDITDRDVEKITLDYTVGRLWRTWKSATRPGRAFTNARRSLQYGRAGFSGGRPISYGNPRSVPCDIDDRNFEPAEMTPISPRAARSSSLPGQLDEKVVAAKAEAEKAKAAKHRSEPAKARSVLGSVIPKDKLPISPRRRSFSDIYPTPGQRRKLIPIPETKKRSRSMSESSKELEEVRMKFFGLRSSKPATIGPKLNHARESAQMKIDIPSGKNAVPVTLLNRGAATPEYRADLESPGNPSPPHSGNRLSMQQLRQRAHRESMRARAHSNKNSQDLGRTSGTINRLSATFSQASPGISEAEEHSDYCTPMTDITPAPLDSHLDENTQSVGSDKSLDRSTTLQTPDTRISLDDTQRSTSPALSSRASTYSTSGKTDYKTSFEHKREMARAALDELQGPKGSLEQQRLSAPEKIEEMDEFEDAQADQAEVKHVGEAEQDDDHYLDEDEKMNRKAGPDPRTGQSAGKALRLQTHGPYAAHFAGFNADLSPDEDLGRHFPSPSTLAPKKIDQVSVSSGTGSRHTSVRKSIIYVDDSAESRASLRRISGHSQGRRNDTGNRTRNASISSLHNKGRDGAISRQSQASTAHSSEIVEREFDDLISAAETQKYTLTPANLRELETPALAKPAAGRWPKTGQHAVPAIEEEMGRPSQLSALETLPDDYRGAVSSEDARRSSGQTRSALSRSTSEKKKGWVLERLTSSSKPSSPRLPQAATSPRSPTMPTSPQIRLLGRDPVPDASQRTRDLSDFFNESRLPASSQAAKKTGNFTPLMPSSPNQPKFANLNGTVPGPSSRLILTDDDDHLVDAEGNILDSSAGPSQQSPRKKHLQPRDPNVQRTTNGDFIAALREGPPGASVVSNVPMNSRVVPPNRTSSTTTGSYVGSAVGSVTSNSALLHQQGLAAGPSASSPRRQNVVRDMYSTDFVDEDDEDALMEMLGPASVTALPERQREDPGESIMDFLKNTPPPAARLEQSKAHHAVEEKRPSRFAAFASFKGNKSSASKAAPKKAAVASEAPVIPMPRGMDIYSARDSRRSANNSGYATPVPEHMRNGSSRLSNQRSSKPNNSFWRKFSG